MRVLPALLIFASPTFAQDQAIQRELIQRQQQNDSFSLQLRQSIEASKVPAGDPARRMELESRQLGERQRLESVSARQFRDVKPDMPQELRPQERTKLERERKQ